MAACTGAGKSPKARTVTAGAGPPFPPLPFSNPGLPTILDTKAPLSSKIKEICSLLTKISTR